MEIKNKEIVEQLIHGKNTLYTQETCLVPVAEHGTSIIKLGENEMFQLKLKAYRDKTREEKKARYIAKTANTYKETLSMLAKKYYDIDENGFREIAKDTQDLFLLGSLVSKKIGIWIWAASQAINPLTWLFILVNGGIADSDSSGLFTSLAYLYTRRILKKEKYFTEEKCV